ncbi:uncharacterized protein TM35_000032600 [Trypanosoma theileri]|uniref:TOG domain-containing protein n=1 Tax=Trypanosoma theileri TaxID=67003 RepID=A0A1X0P6E5_9TRYP|nr:uncharacterized protein TM35_000032600 [Trypanosoma theileri]ORC92507.1 hypothetical protein TM35_000032600 [Trypanosoma theileri]
MGAMFPSEDKYGPRLSMSLCHYSSEDLDHPASALRYHTRSTLGWQSKKECPYPQELGFSFEGEVELRFIRILVHECKIPSRIEVFVSGATEEEIESGKVRSYESSTFHRLGYVQLSTNEENKYAARELKTINVSRRCVYVKLLISRPHRCDYNVFHQVGIIAMTSHGVLLRTLQNRLTKEICLVGEVVEVPLDEMSPPSLDDLEYKNLEENGREIDVPTSRRITEVMLMKDRAVAVEDYDLAASLKTFLVFLEESGKKLYQLEKQKSDAVKKEDYALAKQIKREIDGLREKAYRIPETLLKQNEKIAPLNSSNQYPSLQEEELTQEQPNHIEKPIKSQASPIITDASSPKFFDETPVCGNGKYNFDSSEIVTRIEENDVKGNNGGVNIPLELMEGKPEWEKTINSTILRLSGEQQPASPLKGEVLTEARSSEKVFGTYCSACLFGKKGQLREVAIRAIVSPEGFAALSSHSPIVVETLLLYMALPSRGIADSVAQVVLSSCEALLAILTGKLKDAPLASSLIPQLSSLLPELVNRSGDNNNRVRDTAESVIMGISEIALEAVISALLVDPDKVKKRPVSYKIHLARLNILSSLIDRYYVNGSESISNRVDDILSKVVLNSLQHSNGEVREAANHLFAKILILEPKRAATYLEGLKSSQVSAIKEHVISLKATNPTRKYSTGTESRVTTSSEIAPDTSENNSTRDLPNHISEKEGNHHTMKRCQFCGECDETFTEAGLDIHYIRACPMLCPCPLCDQVTEIATLQPHLTSECENRHLVRECPRCKEAVRVEDFKKHLDAMSCIKAVPTHSVCPLCHARFQTGSAGWLAHLASPPGCPNNPRKYDGTGPIAE